MNKNYLTSEIMERSCHQFIYGYNGKGREEFLKEVVAAYPIILDQSSPVGIYINDKGLPEPSQNSGALDEFRLSIFNRSYLEYLIAYNIINVAVQQIDEKTLNSRSEELLNRVNRLFVSSNHNKLTSLVELSKTLKEAKEIYYDEYIKYIGSGDLSDFYDRVPVNITVMSSFAEYFKRMINTTSYLGIIFDQQDLLSKHAQKAINNYVGSRITANMSMKVACEPEEWKTYYDQNGVLIESTHDYGCVELDNCHSDYIQKLKKKRSIGL